MNGGHPGANAPSSLCFSRHLPQISSFPLVLLGIFSQLARYRNTCVVWRLRLACARANAAIRKHTPFSKNDNQYGRVSFYLAWERDNKLNLFSFIFQYIANPTFEVPTKPVEHFQTGIVRLALLILPPRPELPKSHMAHP